MTKSVLTWTKQDDGTLRAGPYAVFKVTAAPDWKMYVAAFLRPDGWHWLREFGADDAAHAMAICEQHYLEV